MQKRNRPIPEPLIYLLIGIFSLLLLLKEFGSGDELWNFAFALNVSNGMLPYRDFNIVQTPLSIVFPAALMAVFGRNMMIFRLAGVACMAGSMCLTYSIIRKSGHSVFFSFLTCILSFALQVICFVYDYNYLTVLVLLAVVRLEQGTRLKEHTKELVSGFLLGICILLKQNTGLFILLANAVISVLKAVLCGKKKLICFLRITVSAVPGLIFLGYLLLTGTLPDFMEYAVYGIRTFSHRFTPVDFIRTTPFQTPFLLFLPIAFIVIVFRIGKRTGKETAITCIALAVSELALLYPLFDMIHLVCVLFFLTPLFAAAIKPKEYSRQSMTACLVISGIVFLVSAYYMLPNSGNRSFSDLAHFKGTPIRTTLNDSIKEADKYIIEKENEGYHVRIAHDSAAAYMIPLDQYEKNWSMLLVGNIGNASVEDLLESDGPCLYLVFKERAELGEQNHFELIDYISENYRKVDEIESFFVYEN